MDIDRIEATYKRADRSGYPELDDYAWSDIYRDVIGPGGLVENVFLFQYADNGG